MRKRTYLLTALCVSWTAMAHIVLPAEATVTLRIKTGPAGPKIEYQVSGAPKDTTLCVAIVESGLVSQVRRGENAGRTLSHANVVRKFVTLPLDEPTGSVSLDSEF